MSLFSLIEDRKEELLQIEKDSAKVQLNTILESFRIHSNILYFNKIDTEESKNFDEISLEDHYKLYEEKGLNKKEIIKQIAKDRNVNKNEIYMYFLEK